MATAALSWPAVACILIGAGAIAVLRVAWAYRERLGARLWIVTIGSVSVWVLSYGFGLFVFDPQVRMLFEIPQWLGATMSVPLLLAFALEYTGRGRLVRSPWMYGVGLSWLCIGLVYATNPFHHLMWTDYQITPVFGAATVSYTPQVGLWLAHAYAYLVLTLAGVLLIDAIVNYGSLFRVQGVAVLVGVALPVVTNVAWLFGLGPAPQLDLTPAAFFVTTVAGLYAFFVRDMFELSPAVRQLGARAAIDDIGSPVVVVDIKGRVLRLNEPATTVFSADGDDPLTRPLSELTTADVDLSAETQYVSLSVGNRAREFEVSTAPVTDPTGRHIGHTLVFTDITEERQQRQRLEVLNRVLRHNLRNELSVVDARAADIAAQTDDPTVAEGADIITDRAHELINTGTKIRKAATTFEDPQPEVLDVAALVESIRDRAATEAVTVSVSVPAGLTVQSDVATLELVLENLLENAIEHHDETAHVTVRAERVAGSDGVRITVADDGPGIPDHELRPLESGEESPLEHGSGVGLWLIQWGVSVLGGDITFDTCSDGTTITVDVPAWEVPDADTRVEV